MALKGTFSLNDVFSDICGKSDHLEVVVLGLWVLKVTKEILQHKDQTEISVIKVQKVTKEIPVLKVPRVIKMTLVLEVEKVTKRTLKHRELNVIKVIQWL